MMNVDKFLSIKTEYEHFMAIRQDVEYIVNRIKTAVLKLNDQDPSKFSLPQWDIGFYNDEFCMHSSMGLHNYKATKDAVEDYIAKNLTYATVTHIPKTADDIKEGDIFYCSWGATMSLSDFYKVVKRTKCFVTLRELETEEKHDDMFTGMARPLDKFDNHSNVYDGERFVDVDGNVYGQRTIKVDPEGNGSPVLKYRDFMWCRPWDGKAKSFSRRKWFACSEIQRFHVVPSVGRKSKVF